jgi:hypothetical protein
VSDALSTTSLLARFQSGDAAAARVRKQLGKVSVSDLVG